MPLHPPASAHTRPRCASNSGPDRLRPIHRYRPALALLAVVGLGALPAAAELFSGQITRETLQRHRVGGPDAIAGLGDWALANGVVCAAISSPDNESTLSDTGGVLIDLGHCGRDDDQWIVLEPLLNLARDDMVGIHSIRSEISDQRARIVTVGSHHGVQVETIYSLGRSPSNRIRIETRIERHHKGEPIFLFGDVAIHGNGQLSPFTLATTPLGQSPGFQHAEIDVDDALSMAEAILRSDLQILVGGSELEPEITYGWRWLKAEIRRADGRLEGLANLALTGEHFSIIGAYTDTLFFGGEGEPGLLELAQSLFMDVDLGERVVFEREIILGRRAAVSSVTDQIWTSGADVRGQVDVANLSIEVRKEDGTPITHVRPGSSGHFSFRMPPGARGPFELVFRGQALAETRHAFSIPRSGQSINLGEISLAQPGHLRLPTGQIMRLVFEGLGATSNPRLGADSRNMRIGDQRIRAHTESNHISLAGLADDPRELELRPGRYRVLATRGPLWSVGQTEIEIAGGETLELAIAPPQRLLVHPGWLSADLHVHAAPSDDSAFPLRDRIVAFVAQGADLVVSTEHDNVVDYGPMIQRLGLRDQLMSLVGVEITSTFRGDETPYTAGHANAFPLRVEPLAYRGGAPRSQNRRLRSILDDLGRRAPRPLLQLNHPRAPGLDSDLGSFFSHLSVSGLAHDPTLPLDHEQNRPLVERAESGGKRDLDFDAIELLNGPSMDLYRLIRADWFAFLLQGEIRTATANSDSHRANEIIALPRNYVAYSGETGTALNSEALFQAIKEGRVYGSTGPLLEISIGGMGPGERFVGKSASLEIRVRAAEWVPVNEVRIFVNGGLHSRKAISSSSNLTVPLQFERDSFVTVEVEGRVAEGSIYSGVAPRFTPFAFTNPILVDANGNGQWEPPGLAPPLPSTLTDPTASP